jgi:hypothetical protein
MSYVAFNLYIQAIDTLRYNLLSTLHTGQCVHGSLKPVQIGHSVRAGALEHSDRIALSQVYMAYIVNAAS